MITPTIERPRPAPPPPPARTPSVPPARPGEAGPSLLAAAFGARSPAGRTARTWLGLALGLTPLFMIVSDSTWYVVGLGAMAVAVGPAWVLRWWQHGDLARVWQLLPGLILLPLYLTAVCVPQGAWGGVVPTGTTWTQLSLLHDELLSTIASSTAPIQSTPGVRIALAALLGLGAIMVDTLGTVLEAPAMVGVVLLPIYVLSGAPVRQPVTWWLFGLAAVGYLLMLSTTGPASHAWGREIGRRPDGAPPSLVSGTRIATITVLVAMVLPMFAVGQAYNALTDALHTSGGDGSGNGRGSGTGGVTQLASLKGTLSLGTPVALMTVTVPKGLPVEPYYLRQSVLDLFTGDGWVPAGLHSATPLRTSGLPQDPPRSAGAGVQRFRADVAVSGLDGRPVDFGDTVGAAGLPGGTTWDAAHGTFGSGTVGRGTRYSLAVEQPNPSPAALAAAAGELPAGFPAIWRGVPDGIDPSVGVLTRAVVGAATGPYDVAKALVTYFTDPANGFSYSLSVRPGDSGNDLVDFLRSKQGFCQQYAAAMAVMLRLAGVPSRVVVGYTHVAPDKNGTFTVTTRDAHAWVEAYIGGVGWTSFDPTPLTGANAARRVPLTYLSPTGPATGTGPSTQPTTPAGRSGVGNKAQQDLAGGGALLAPPTGRPAPDHAGDWAALWTLVGLAAVLLVAPVTRRRLLRRRRLRQRGPDAAEARFAELRDVCLDLGLGWSPARSPRQTATWLAGFGVPRAMLDPLVGAVEQARYGRHPEHAPDLRPVDPALARTVRMLRSRTSWRQRLQAVWWPRSVVRVAVGTARARTAALREVAAGWSPPTLRGLSRKRVGSTR